jgi:hypothetical protein
MCKYAYSDIAEAGRITGAAEKVPLVEANEAEFAEPGVSLERGEMEIEKTNMKLKLENISDINAVFTMSAMFEIDKKTYQSCFEVLVIEHLRRHED